MGLPAVPRRTYLYPVHVRESHLFFLLCLLSASILVVPSVYLCGDGPSHLYNARVLFDAALGRDRDFYEAFFHINRHIDPNWLSHLALGTLMQFMPALWADKVLQLIYLGGFAYGFRYLVRSVNSDNGFLAFLFFPLAFTQPFQQGFYNYCLALALMCWTLGFFLRNLNNFMTEPLKQFILALLLLATTFAHGMPALYTLALIGVLWLLHQRKTISLSRLGLQATAVLALMALPSAFVIGLFVLRRGSATVPHAWSVWVKFTQFLKGWTSQCIRAEEVYPATAFMMLCGALFIFGLLRYRKSFSLAAWGFVGLAVFTFAAYLRCPHSVGGAGSLDIRLAYLPPLFLLVGLAALPWSAALKHTVKVSGFMLASAFLLIRFPAAMQGARIVQEIRKAAAFIPKHSIVLNLDADAWADSLMQRDGSFLHAGDLLGTEQDKPVILLMNYEAEIDYFPVNWMPGMNPRQSIEGLIPGTYPPCGDPLAYERQIGRRIDRLTITNPKSYAQPCYHALRDSIQRHFEPVYANASVEVYRRRED